MISPILAVGLSLALVVVSVAARAESVDIVASRDATLYRRTDGKAANGSGEHFFAGLTAGGELRRALLYFDLGPFVPKGAHIESATLKLRMTRSSNSNPYALSLFRVTSLWGEGASNATGEEGQGVAALPGDATWIHAFFDTVLWSTPGGDFAPGASSTLQVSGIGSYTWPGLGKDVQLFSDDPDSNFGWLLVGNELSSRSAKRFDSRENADSASRPVLSVEYSVPEPGAAPLGALAVFAVLGRRRALGWL